MGNQHGLLRALFLIISILHGSSAKITFPLDSSIVRDREYVRSLEFSDSDNEIYSEDRKPRDDRDWRNGWDSRDKRKDWNPPDEKTISVQLLDEDPYHHGRPAWPHDEYLLGLGYFDLNRTPGSNDSSSSPDTDTESIDNQVDDIRKFYEWKRLQARPTPSPSAFIGPGFYDVGSGTSDYYDTTAPAYYKYQPTHQAIADGTGKVQSTGSNGDTVPGTASESNTNTRHFSPYAPYDYFNRKRVRLQIHPGLIAAPLAGLAAFGAASALTSKPLLLELGYVRNRNELAGAGGWGLAGGFGGGGYRPYPAFYPPPNPPPHGLGGIGGIPPLGGGIPPGGLGHGHHAQAYGSTGGGPVHPILRPTRHRPDDNRSWWNPFSALTPRLVIE